MTNYNRLREESQRLQQKTLAEMYGWQLNTSSIALEAEKTADLARYSNTLIEEIDSQFEKATALDKTDITFLLFATALQCIRQYVIGTITQRTDDKTAAKNTKGHEAEHTDRNHQLYNPSVEQIIVNPVPFDAIMGGKNYGLGIGGGFTHRAKTVGHDPLLGWIVGTMNIATSTVTVSDRLKSFHVRTGQTINELARDEIHYNADYNKIKLYTKKKLFDEGTTGKEKIGLAVMKEAIHLNSDIYSTASLPIPIVSTLSVEAARNLADYGVDMGNVVKVAAQAEVAILINSIIGMIHGLFYDESLYCNRKMYAVKTRKILSYSNLIASASNVIAVAIAAAVGASTGNTELVKKSVNYLDLGGVMVTIYRVVSDRQFIYEVKKEFLSQQWYDMVLNG